MVYCLSEQYWVLWNFKQSLNPTLAVFATRVLERRAGVLDDQIKVLARTLVCIWSGLCRSNIEVKLWNLPFVVCHGLICSNMLHCSLAEHCNRQSTCYINMSCLGPSDIWNSDTGYSTYIYICAEGLPL